MKKEIKKPAPNKSKRGRKKGSKTTHTVEGAGMFENQLRAHWGASWNTTGAAFAHQAWIDRHPSCETLRLRADARRLQPAEVLKEIQKQPLAPEFAAIFLAAIDRRDSKFFHDFAEGLQRIKIDGSLDVEEKSRSALLHYVERETARNRKRKFARAELLDDVPWGKDGYGQTFRPSDSQLDRLTAKLSVPMQRGRRKR
ncbi:MAG: hypothetical protein H7343_20340 [Undibacterium sp.]|nr:hypothetical protein [Opitutaceae bacterium]